MNININNNIITQYPMVYRDHGSRDGVGSQEVVGSAARGPGYMGSNDVCMNDGVGSPPIIKNIL